MELFLLDAIAAYHKKMYAETYDIALNSMILVRTDTRMKDPNEPGWIVHYEVMSAQDNFRTHMVGFISTTGHVAWSIPIPSKEAWAMMLKQRMDI